MMACHQTCVDIGKSCNYAVRRSSCADCGKVGDCKYFISSNFVCPCDDKTPTLVPVGCAPCATNNTTKTNNIIKTINTTKTNNATKTNNEKHDPYRLDLSPTRPSAKPIKPNDSDKQTFWQWLLSLIGLGKKNEVSKDSYKRTPTLELKPKFQEEQENDTHPEAKDPVGPLDKQEKRRETEIQETSPGSVSEEVNKEKLKDNRTKAKQKNPRKRRSQSADSKSRNKYLGRPLEPSPPSKRKPSSVKSPQSPQAYKKPSDSPKSPPETTILPTETKAVIINAENPNSTKTEPPEQTAQTKRPPISPIYSSEKHLQPYQPTCEQTANPITNTCDAPPLIPKEKKKEKHSCPSCAEPFEKSFASMSCHGPSYPSTCICQTSPESCCNPKPCCQPSITSLMRKRFPSPNKVTRRRSKSCTSPRCINECTALIRNEMKQKRRKNTCQVCCVSSSGKCCCCVPVSCTDAKCSPVSCTVKCQCCPKPTESPKSPKPCANMCQPPPTLKSALSITPSSYGKCPITCMRPCCVPMPVTPFSRCSSAKSICPPSGCCSPSIKTHTVSAIPKTSVISRFPPFCSTFCNPNSLKSYARSKDGDAYCKFLMSRYNVSVPDDPPLFPMTLSGCSPLPPVTVGVHEHNRPYFTNRCNDACNATGNYSEQGYNTGVSSSKAQQETDNVLYNASPSKKQSVSAFRLPKRTPVECIREQGPRSPVREYTSKLGLPNKQPRSSPPAPTESNKETTPEIGEKQLESKQKGKSPKKKKNVNPKEEGLIPEENDKGEKNVTGQNKSENKTTSDNGTAINNNSYLQVSVPPGELQRVQQVKYTKKICSKHCSPVKEYITVGSNEHFKNGSSFYRNFLDISPRSHLTKESSNAIKYTHCQSPTFSKRSPITGSPVQIIRSKSISPPAVKKTLDPCNMAANTSCVKKSSPCVSINSLLHRNSHPEPKLQSPKIRDKVSLLYKERSLILESKSGQTTSSKRNRKVESPTTVKLVKQNDRDYQDLYIQSAERAYNKAVLEKETKTELNANEKLPIFFDDKETTRPPLEPSPIILRATKMSRSVSPHYKHRKQNLSDQLLAADNKVESATSNSKTLSNKMNVLRDEIVALLRDSIEDLPDEDSLKTDTTECLTDGIVEQHKTNKNADLVTKIENEQSPLKIKAHVVIRVSPCREHDGSSSVDGTFITEKSHQNFPEKNTCIQEQFPYKSHCESSVDPKKYGTFGDSCVDPATFHSDGSIQCCPFHTKPSYPKYSSNNLGVLVQTSTSVDSCDPLPHYHKNKSNNYNTGNCGGAKNSRENAGDIENKHDTALIGGNEFKSDTAKVVCSSTAENSVRNAGIGRIFNKLRNEFCNNYYGIGFHNSSSVDEVEGDLCNYKTCQESDVDGADFKQSSRLSDKIVTSGSVSEKSVNISNNNQDQPDDVNNTEKESKDPNTADVKRESHAICSTTNNKTREELQNVSQPSADNAKMTGACSGPIETDNVEEGNDVIEIGSKCTQKPSLIHELLSSSQVKWQKVGPVTETDSRIMRIAKAALMTTASTTCDKADSLPPSSIMFKSQCEEQEGFRDFRSVLLKPEEKEGEEQSILSRINDF